MIMSIYTKSLTFLPLAEAKMS